jgi:hypothetical protein
MHRKPSPELLASGDQTNLMIVKLEIWMFSERAGSHHFAHNKSIDLFVLPLLLKKNKTV